MRQRVVNLAQQFLKKRPKVKVPAKLVWLIGYIRDASMVERRVMWGTFLFVLIEGGMIFYGGFVIGAAKGIIAAIFGMVIFALLGLGLSVPPFIGVAWSGLFRRYWMVYSDGIMETWVNPHIELEAPYDQPGYVRRLRGRGKVVVECNFPDYQGVLPERRKHTLYTTTSVHSAVYHDPDEEHFRQPPKGPMLPIRMGAIAVIIAISLFFTFALATNPESF